jgi:competence protein ComFC
MLKAVTNSLLSIAFPQNCHSCTGMVDDRAGGVACSTCWSATRVFSDDFPTCRKCGNFLPSGLTGRDIQCHECEGQFYDSATSGGVYEHALVAVILELKRSPYLPQRAADLLLSALERSDGERPDVLMPVPLSPKRKGERGFNQAEVIGRFLSGKIGIPLDTFSLVRSKHTPMHRAGMDRKARDLTVKNAFEVFRPSLVKGRSVVLVDDIFTTGATASYCAKELKKNGAMRVRVVTLARAVRNLP